MNTKTILSISGLMLFLALGCSFIPGSVAPTAIPSTPTPFISPAQVPPLAGDLSGTYEGGGTNPDGSAYKVQVDVQDLGGYYSLAWSNGTSGHGLRRGDVLAASFGGEQCAIVLYTIGSDYSLTGDWLTLRQSPGTEDATPKGTRNALEGDFDIRGLNPDGSAYQGTLSLSARGDLWQVTWYVPNELGGFGVVLENTLAVTYGSSRCGVVSYRIIDDDTLDGLWGWWSTTTAGTETVTR